jgi:hypothetical protein
MINRDEMPEFACEFQLEPNVVEKSVAVCCNPLQRPPLLV